MNNNNFSHYFIENLILYLDIDQSVWQGDWSNIREMSFQNNISKSKIFFISFLNQLKNKNNDNNNNNNINNNTQRRRLKRKLSETDLEESEIIKNQYSMDLDENEENENKNNENEPPTKKQKLSAENIINNKSIKAIESAKELLKQNNDDNIIITSNPSQISEITHISDSQTNENEIIIPQSPSSQNQNENDKKQEINNKQLNSDSSEYGFYDLPDVQAEEEIKIIKNGGKINVSVITNGNWDNIEPYANECDFIEKFINNNKIEIDENEGDELNINKVEKEILLKDPRYKEHYKWCMENICKFHSNKNNNNTKNDNFNGNSSEHDNYNSSNSEYDGNNNNNNNTQDSNIEQKNDKNNEYDDNNYNDNNSEYNDNKSEYDNNNYEIKNNDITMTTKKFSIYKITIQNHK